MKKPKGITIIENAIAETMAIFSCIKRESLLEDGAIFYANGNDGTDFDWRCNSCLPEFYVYHGDELGQMGYIKVRVFKNGKMTIYVYPCGEMKPTYTVERECGFSAEHLKHIMLCEADRAGKWDKKLSEIFED